MSTTYAIISTCTFVAFLLAALGFFVKRQKKRNSRAAHVAERSDENPVYGLYYFANGEHIDNATVEACDDNPYYDT